jgi:ATP-dependent DNA helicase 2 subunit 2
MVLGIVGTCAFAIQETTRPDIKQVRSALMGTVLRIGDVDARADEAIELSVKTTKCTAFQRPKGWKKFALREDKDEGMEEEEIDPDKAAFAQLRLRTEYYVDRNPEEADEDGDVKMKQEDEDETLLEDGEKDPEVKNLEKVVKEELVRGFKYGTTYAPCPDGQFPKLQTRRGIDICGFFPRKNVSVFLIDFAMNIHGKKKM